MKNNELTNKQAKAIRTILGFNDDLRHSLVFKYQNNNDKLNYLMQETVYDFIQEHKTTLFGNYILERAADPITDYEWNQIIIHAMWQVIGK